LNKNSKRTSGIFQTRSGIPDNATVLNLNPTVDRSFFNLAL